MSTDLVNLGTKAAEALVAAMVGEAWHERRGLFGRLLGRGHAAAEDLQLQKMNRDSDRLVSVPPAERRQAEEEMERDWTVRFRDFLDEHPEAAEELRTLLGSLPARSVSSATNINVSARTKQGDINQRVGDINVRG